MWLTLETGQIVLETLLFIAACLALPIVWGIVVNWLFDAWQSRTADKSDDEPVFPDYQI